MVDRHGAAVSIELFPGGPGLFEPVDGLLVRTNHFVSDRGRDGCLASTIGVSTELRRDHLVDAMSRRRPQSPADVVEAMTHHLPDGGVCKHPLTDTDPVLWHRTLATVSIDVASCALDVAANGPCGHRFEPVEQPA